MKTISLALLLSLCVCTALFAQNPYQVKGIVADSANKSMLQNASISVLNAKDSTLYKFTRANAKGDFLISPMKKGNFILLLTYPEYADYVSSFTLDSSKTSLDFKQINMKLKATLLNEVLIKGQAAAIKIKGDTTEFNAAAYAIQPNDKVEDLLKKFPGMQIDKDGKITAQGKTVTKVLVDGEEFFGDDPTLATRNLRADMVDKVQLFDKASEQAAFTGVDDGQKATTLNVILKEDKKSGYFGKVDAGAGTEGFYDAQVMFNRFKAKQKFSLYGTAANNGKTGLSWDDASKYNTGNNNMEMFDGGFYFSGSGDEIDNYGGQYGGEGIPRAYNGGAHYDTKWNGDKESINTNYKIGSLGVKATKNTINQNNLPATTNNPSGVINSNTDENSDRYIFRQKLDAIYTIKIDSTTNLKVTVDGTLKNSDSESINNSTGLRGDGTLLNTTERTNSSDGKDQVFNMTAFLTKKLKKTGRSYTVNVSQRLSENDNEGFLKSTNSFFDPNELQTSSEVVDQFKTNNTKNSVFTSNITYNEPLSKTFSLILNYGFGINYSRADKKSFNASSPGNYDQLDTEFSNDFKATQYSNQAGVVFNYKKPKSTLNFGTKINAVNFDQYEAISNQSYKRSFLNWIPQASYQYRFSAQKSLRVSYNGYTNQPTVEQLQPVRVNTDPLNIPLGNPDLKPSYSNSININYNSYKVLANQSLYFSAYYSTVSNQIVNNTTTDDEGRSLRQAINLREKMPSNYSLWGGFRRKIDLADFNAGINLSANGSESFNYINTNLNKTTSTSISPRASISRYKDKFELDLSFGPSYNSQVASINKSLSNKGWGTSGYGSFKVILPKKITIQADAEYNYQPKSASFDSSFEQMIINSSITKSFFKKDDLKLVLKGNDLLNQNRGFRRFASANSITQTSYNNINRYYMFSLVWDFNKMGGTTK
ncbi:outer membrane beta-barrel protein [Pedobacter namyangjuensis]|uniref:outer membrane beta-barrel protein n=1 Tax=Pedobacter namyangjuensis TaxID=600626 RepID=UPI000DE46FBE|nr:outer membrane beta-barrel protein [Pedobacter namyangjuensis]